MWKKQRCQAGAMSHYRPLRNVALALFFGASGRTGQTVDLVQTGLFWNGGRCVFVERAPVAREIKLLVDIDVLILEDLRRVCQVMQTHV